MLSPSPPRKRKEGTVAGFMHSMGSRVKMWGRKSRPAASPSAASADTSATVESTGAVCGAPGATVAVTPVVVSSSRAPLPQLQPREQQQQQHQQQQLSPTRGTRALSDPSAHMHSSFEGRQELRASMTRSHSLEDGAALHAGDPPRQAVPSSASGTATAAAAAAAAPAPAPVRVSTRKSPTMRPLDVARRVSGIPSQGTPTASPSHISLGSQMGLLTPTTHTPVVGNRRSFGRSAVAASPMSPTPPSAEAAGRTRRGRSPRAVAATFAAAQPVPAGAGSSPPPYSAGDAAGAAAYASSDGDGTGFPASERRPSRTTALRSPSPGLGMPPRSPRPVKLAPLGRSPTAELESTDAAAPLSAGSAGTPSSRRRSLAGSPALALRSLRLEREGSSVGSPGSASSTASSSPKKLLRSPRKSLPLSSPLTPRLVAQSSCAVDAGLPVLSTRRRDDDDDASGGGGGGDNSDAVSGWSGGSVDWRRLSFTRGGASSSDQGSSYKPSGASGSQRHDSSAPFTASDVSAGPGARRHSAEPRTPTATQTLTSKQSRNGLRLSPVGASSRRRLSEPVSLLAPNITAPALTDVKGSGAPVRAGAAIAVFSAGSHASVDAATGNQASGADTDGGERRAHTQAAGASTAASDDSPPRPSTAGAAPRSALLRSGGTTARPATSSGTRGSRRKFVRLGGKQWWKKMQKSTVKRKMHEATARMQDMQAQEAAAQQRLQALRDLEATLPDGSSSTVLEQGGDGGGDGADSDGDGDGIRVGDPLCLAPEQYQELLDASEHQLPPATAAKRNVFALWWLRRARLSLHFWHAYQYDYYGYGYGYNGELGAGYWQDRVMHAEVPTSPAKMFSPGGSASYHRAHRLPHTPALDTVQAAEVAVPGADAAVSGSIGGPDAFATDGDDKGVQVAPPAPPAPQLGLTVNVSHRQLPFLHAPLTPITEDPFAERLVDTPASSMAPTPGHAHRGGDDKDAAAPRPLTPPTEAADEGDRPSSLDGAGLSLSGSGDSPMLSSFNGGMDGMGGSSQEDSSGEAALMPSGDEFTDWSWFTEDNSHRSDSVPHQPYVAPMWPFWTAATQAASVASLGDDDFLGAGAGAGAAAGAGAGAGAAAAAGAGAGAEAPHGSVSSAGHVPDMRVLVPPLYGRQPRPARDDASEKTSVYSIADFRPPSARFATETPRFRARPACVIAAYEAQDDTELALEVSDIVMVESEDPSGWWQGYRYHPGVDPETAPRGWFPCTYIQWTDPTPAMLEVLDTDTVTDAGREGSWQLPNASDASGVMWKLNPDTEIWECYDMDGNKVAEQHADPFEPQVDPDAPQAAGADLVMAMSQYVAEDVAELSLDHGDRVWVLQRDDSGWWHGRNTVTDAEGWFPSSYVVAALPHADSLLDPPQ